jgi:3-dehydroquinate synthase
MVRSRAGHRPALEDLSSVAIDAVRSARIRVHPRFVDPAAGRVCPRRLYPLDRIMNPSETIPAVRFAVRTPSREYPIEIAIGVTARLGSLLDAAGAPARRLIVSSPTVWRFHQSAFNGVTQHEPILIPDGERFKHLATVGRIYDALIRVGADRATSLIAIGGGVVGDVAGLAAATYLRGIPLVHVPTTLLAQVDSAIGGKVGVNHPLGKNLIGAFHQPLMVAVDPALLATLPRREFRAGLYEVVKYGMIASRSLFEKIVDGLPVLFAREPGLLVPVIAESCRIKAATVEADERESGPRRALNFGHTVGHALEAITKYRRFRHGEAVAYGMLAAGALAVARGALAESDLTALRMLITKMGPLPAVADLPASQALEAVTRDKKVIAGKLHFVLPTAIGQTITVADVTPEELTRAVEAIGLKSA